MKGKELMELEAMAWPHQLHKFLEAISRGPFGREKLLLPNLPKYGAHVNTTKHPVVQYVVPFDNTHLKVSRPSNAVY